MKRLVVATTNPGKVREFQSVLAGLKDWEVIVQPENIPEIEETGKTFEENALLKAVHTSHYVDDIVVADDSGLCVDALDGRPGVWSHRYAADDPTRIQRLLTELQSVPDSKRGAAFVCALALAQRGASVWTTEGQLHGSISREPRGTHGFGYDPIFWLPEFGQTLAELTLDQKNRISHRGRALQDLMRHFLVSNSL